MAQAGGGAERKFPVLVNDLGLVHEAIGRPSLGIVVYIDRFPAKLGGRQESREINAQVSIAVDSGSRGDVAVMGEDGTAITRRINIKDSVVYIGSEEKPSQPPTIGELDNASRALQAAARAIKAQRAS